MKVSPRTPQGGSVLHGAHYQAAVAWLEDRGRWMPLRLASIEAVTVCNRASPGRNVRTERMAVGGVGRGVGGVERQDGKVLEAMAAGKQASARLGRRRRQKEASDTKQREREGYGGETE
jgi:hypothetical protein